MLEFLCPHIFMICLSSWSCLLTCNNFAEIFCLIVNGSMHSIINAFSFSILLKALLLCGSSDRHLFIWNADMVLSSMGKRDEMTANQWHSLSLSCLTIKDKTCQSVRINKCIVIYNYLSNKSHKYSINPLVLRLRRNELHWVFSFIVLYFTLHHKKKYWVNSTC